MDILDELETMASTIGVDPAPEDQGALESEVGLFQGLFQYSYEKAKAMIERRRWDVSRLTVSDAHWELVREDREAEEYSRAAYEHAVEIGAFARRTSPVNGRRSQRQQPEQIAHESRRTYLVKLEGPLNSAQQIQELSGTLELPSEVANTGEDSGEAARFCLINDTVRRLIVSKFPRFNPTFVQINMAAKQLSAYSSSPTLGEIEPTLPQHRTDKAEHIPSDAG